MLGNKGSKKFYRTGRLESSAYETIISSDIVTSLSLLFNVFLQVGPEVAKISSIGKM
jgi:hypothetical protein